MRSITSHLNRVLQQVMTMEPVTVQRRHKRINRKTKLNLIFDENARREYLTGFHKRKLQRKKRAEEEFKQKLKEERKRIQEESKAQYKKLVKTFQPIPELEEQLAQEYQVKNTTVSILELDTDLLAERNFIIGRNRTGYEPIKEDNGSENSDDEEGLPGMELKTKKEIKKELKKKATSTVKKSKVFKKKNKMEQARQRKKSMNKKKELEKIKSKRRNKLGTVDLKKKGHKVKYSKRK